MIMLHSWKSNFKMFKFGCFIIFAISAINPSTEDSVINGYGPVNLGDLHPFTLSWNQVCWILPFLFWLCKNHIIVNSLLVYFIDSISFKIYICKNGRTDVCFLVHLLVCGGLMEIQTPALILMKFARTFLPGQGRFWCRFDPLLPPPLAWGAWISKTWRTIRCSAGCIFTRAAPGTSASTK